MVFGYAGLVLIVVIFFAGIRIVRPTHRGLVERLGKYRRFAGPGFNWIIPIIDRMISINVTEQMVDAQPQEIITFDNLNARVDAQVYFKVKSDEESVKNSQYNVNDYQWQIVNLARTTLRNIIGTLTLKSANSERDKINTDLLTVPHPGLHERDFVIIPLAEIAGNLNIPGHGLLYALINQCESHSLKKIITGK